MFGGFIRYIVINQMNKRVFIMHLDGCAASYVSMPFLFRLTYT